MWWIFGREDSWEDGVENGAPCGCAGEQEEEGGAGDGASSDSVDEDVSESARQPGEGGVLFWKTEILPESERLQHRSESRAYDGSFRGGARL